MAEPTQGGMLAAYAKANANLESINADLLAALEEIAGVSTGENADYRRAVLEMSDIARAAISRAEKQG